MSQRQPFEDQSPRLREWIQEQNRIADITEMKTETISELANRIFDARSNALSAFWPVSPMDREQSRQLAAAVANQYLAGARNALWRSRKRSRRGASFRVR